MDPPDILTHPNPRKSTFLESRSLFDVQFVASSPGPKILKPGDVLYHHVKLDYVTARLVWRPKHNFKRCGLPGGYVTVQFDPSVVPVKLLLVLTKEVSTERDSAFPGCALTDCGPGSESRVLDPYSEK